MTFADVITKWLEFRAQLAALDGIAPSTEAKQRQATGTLTRGLGHHEIGELRPSVIQLWAAQRAKEVAPATLQTEMRLLQQILNWTVDEGILAQRPKLPTVTVPNVEPTLPADDQFAWYLTNLAPRHSEALEFMLLTGLAPHELARLQPRDMSEDGLSIGDRDDFRVKAAARRRPVPLNVRAATIWARWSMGLAPDTAVFPKEGTLQKAMVRLQPPAGFDHITPKIMRKWFASKVAAEHSEAVLQRLLGHSPGSKVTRKHYVRTQDEQLHAAVDGLTIDTPVTTKEK